MATCSSDLSFLSPSSPSHTVSAPSPGWILLTLLPSLLVFLFFLLLLLPSKGSGLFTDRRRQITIPLFLSSVSLSVLSSLTAWSAYDEVDLASCLLSSNSSCSSCDLSSLSSFSSWRPLSVTLSAVLPLLPSFLPFLWTRRAWPFVTLLSLCGSFVSGVVSFSQQSSCGRARGGGSVQPLVFYPLVDPSCCSFASGEALDSTCSSSFFLLQIWLSASSLLPMLTAFPPLSPSLPSHPSSSTGSRGPSSSGTNQGVSYLDPTYSPRRNENGRRSRDGEDDWSVWR